MRKLYNSLFLSILFVMTFMSFAQAQITVLKSTTSLCRDIAMPVYYTAYGCDGQVQWLNWLQEPIGTSNVSSDSPGYQGSNTYYVKCGTGSPQVFFIDKTATVRSTTPSIGASSTTINNGENTTLTASGCGGTVSWMSGNYVLSNSSTLVVTPTTSTSYYALCTESGKCVSEASTQTITVTVNNQSLAAPVINTQNLGALSVGTSTTLGAFNCYYTVQWYKNGSSIGSGNSINVTPATCDSYTATCVNGSIASPASNALAVSGTNPTITNQPQASSVCEGTTATLSVVATGASGYQWRKDGTNISGETNASLTVTNITSANAGAYDVVINSACGSVTSQPATFTVLPSVAPTITTQPASSNVCIGGNHTLSVVATGASSYQWRLNGVYIAGETNASLLVSNVTAANAGPYSVIVAGNCSGTASQNASLYPVTADATSFWKEPVSATKCIGGTVSFEVGVNGYPSNYQWYKNGNPIGSPSQVQVPLTLSNLQPSDAGNYYCVVTHPCGTITTVTAVLTVSAGPSLSFSTNNVKCFGLANGLATVTPTSNSPYSYSWTNGGTSATINNLTPNTYTVTVTDGNGCTKSGSVSITEPAALGLSTSNTAVSCKNGSNGSITANPSGGTSPYSYAWSNGATTQTINNLSAGTYSVTITDANGCTKNTFVVVTEPTILTYQFTKDDVKCNAGSDGKITAIAQGGTSPYKLIYNGTASTDLTVATLRAGDYSINVQDNNNCLATEQRTTLTQPVAIEVSITDELMPRGFQTKDGRLVTKIVGGTTKQTSLYTTAWLFEGTTTVLDKQVVIAGGTSSTIEKIQGGNYILTVTDDNFALSKTNEGCRKVFPYFVKRPDKIVSVAAVDKSVSCFGKSDGKLTATVKGGVIFKTGATYLYKWFKQDQAEWINLNLSTATIQYVDAGQYMVKIEDANGITDSTQVSLKVTPSISSKVISQVNPSCSASKDGLIEVQAIGAVQPITVTWSKALTGTKIANLAQGNYFGIIKDNAGCFGEVTVTLTAKENVSAELISKKELVCADKCDAMLELAVKGANSPYTVQWSNGATGLKNSQLCAGTYSATIKTTNGCAVSMDNMKLDAPQAFKIEVSNDIDICSESTLEINAASKVSQGLSYVWTYPNGTKSNNSIASIKTAGTYKIEVINASGCSASDEFKVNVQNVITGINFTVASQGKVGESIYAVNLSPLNLATTWNVIGSADILQNDKAILVIKPTAEGTLKIELTATVGTCKASLIKSIAISKASTEGSKSIPTVESVSIDDLFLVYPNPNEGHFVIKADPSMEGEVQIKIYNANLSEILYSETFDTATKSQVEVTIPEVINNPLYVVIQSQNKKTIKRVWLSQ